MQRKFEKFKARQKRKAKEAGLGIKYSSLESKECKTQETKLKRLKSVTKTKPKRHRHEDSAYTVSSSLINQTDQMKNLDLRPLIIEIFD